jgi:hypothetical protein
MTIDWKAMPPALLAALKRQHLSYTNPVSLYHLVWNDHTAVGVFGDGANGAYEWFIWDDDAVKLRTSDCGFGSDHGALCCGLVESGATRPNGDHDLLLTWKRKGGQS